MNILEVIPSLGSGGAESFVCELSNSLESNGHRVTILTFYDKINNLENKLNPNIRRCTISKKKGPDIGLFFKLLSFIKNENFDVLHSHSGAIKYTILLPIFCKSTKNFATIHSEARREAGNVFERNIKKFLFKTGLCQAIAISNESEKSFFEFYHKHAPIVLNGVSPYYCNSAQNLIKKCNEELIFFHAASCQKVKNQERLFRAFNSLLEKYPNIRLIWAGNNSLYYELYESLKPLMNDRIKYIGEVDNPRDYMYNADAFCLSSNMEGLPMTIIEAFSVGCPVLCTPVGGCVDIVKNGENGFLSKGMSVEEYADILKKFIELSIVEKQKMKNCALQSFSKYSIEQTTKGYIKLFLNRTK